MVDSTPITIAPNPIKGNAKIDLSRIKGSKSISIFNAVGTKIDEWETDEKFSELNSSQFNNGLFILKVCFNNRAVCIKFIKQ